MKGSIGKLYAQYAQILSIFVSNLPEEGSRADFQYSDEFLTKDRIASKIKQFHINIEKAIDSRKQAGTGIIVATFHKICNEIWSGSPATESRNSGIENTLEGIDKEENDQFEELSNTSNGLGQNFDGEEHCETFSEVSVNSERQSQNNPPSLPPLLHIQQNQKRPSNK